MFVELSLAVGTLVFLYLFISWLYSSMYVEPDLAQEPVEDLSIVLTTVASSGVEDSLMGTIRHHREAFPEYPLYVVMDEGAELRAKVEALDVERVIVPDSYQTDAIAKGRAQQYFVDEYVSRDEWYVFVDDDSRIASRHFMYEIPTMGEEYAVANGYVWPRQGKSPVAFVLDHMRSLFDLFVFRATVGFLGKPLAGLHGEALIVRGDCLKDVGFAHGPTIVEDYVFADKVLDSRYKTWMSDTTISILSPNSIRDFLKQRRRWFSGKVEYYPSADWRMAAVSISIDILWLLGIVAGYLAAGYMLATATVLTPFVALLPVLAAVVFTATYLVGVLRLGWDRPYLLLLAFAIPIIATIEHLAGWYSLLSRTNRFDVIDKSE